MVWMAQDVFRLAIVSLMDEKPPVENIPVPIAYLFGHTEDNERSIIEAGYDLYKNALAQKLYVCGDGPYISPLKPDAPVSYNGEDAWRKQLIKMGIPAENIIGIPRPEGISNTATEAKGLVLLAKEMYWEDIFIVADPFHMPRAFANTITQALMHYPNLRIWCKSGTPLPWAEKVLSSQGIVGGTRLEEVIDAEFKQLEKIYGNTVDIAPPEQIFEYIKTRN